MTGLGFTLHVTAVVTLVDAGFTNQKLPTGKAVFERPEMCKG